MARRQTTSGQWPPSGQLKCSQLLDNLLHKRKKLSHERFVGLVGVFDVVFVTVVSDDENETENKTENVVIIIFQLQQQQVMRHNKFRSK